MNNNNDLKDGKVVQKQLHMGRWFLILEFPRKYRGKTPENPTLNNEKRKVRQSHYNWLIGNPSFVNIPKGYVIHHLDGDKLNDDVSNLALMNRTHHMAYHAKQIPIDPVEIELRGIPPISENDVLGENPGKFNYRKRRKGLQERWYIRWSEGSPGNRYNRKICTYKGKAIENEDQVIKVVKQLEEIKEKYILNNDLLICQRDNIG